MKKIYLVFVLVGCLTSFLSAQKNPMTNQKGNRTTKEIKTGDLNPIKIDGSKNNQPSTTSTPLPNVSESNLDIVYSDDNGMPIQIKGSASSKTLGGLTDSEIQEAVYDYLNGMKRTLKIDNTTQEFGIMNTETDDIGMTHIRMQQYFMGLKVYGGDLILHADKNGQLQSLNGRFYPTPSIDNVMPTINKEVASQNVINDVKNETVYKELTEQEKALLQSDQTEARLVIYHKGIVIEGEKLAWHITIRPNFVERWEYFVDAENGEILYRLNHTCSLDGPTTATAVDLFGLSRTINVYEKNNSFFMIDGSQSMFNLGASTLPDDPRGAIWTIDANNTSPQNNLNVSHVTSSNNQWNNPTAVSAHYNGEKSYDYFKNTHNRNSINGNGGRIVSIINVSDENGGSMDNAFWNGAAIFYGNGGNAFQPLAKGLDVAGHEMSHGVISNSANLQYNGQSGALNESFADIFGVMIDRDDWNVGDDVANTSAFPTGTMRSMSDPHNGGSSLNDPGYQPRHMNEIYTGSQDNGGVHINSGIANWAFYKYATAVGKDKAEDVYYRALVSYLTANSQFVDARLAVIQAATDIHGASSNEVTEAGLAFDAVGIAAPGGGGGGGGGSTSGGGGTNVGVIQPGDLAAVNGPDFLMLHDTDGFNSNTLYTFDPSNNNFNALSTTTLVRPPSITDDGSYTVYVGADNVMRGLQLDGSSSEAVIQSNPIWENVAISKDGNRLAAITTGQDTSIWVYDFISAQWATFKLYSPTATQGVSSNDVVFADALEWDYSGEYLMYDAFNKINGFGGQDIEYWDVGVLRVWDTTANNFGDGTISKLFSNLPEDISIGNPSFSKNSPYIVTFDYIDVAKNEYYLISVNLVNGSIGTVFQNTQLSYPNYNMLDDEIVFDAENSAGESVLATIDVDVDKLTPIGQASILIQEAKWGKWFAQGDRDGLSSSIEIENNNLKLYPNPVTSVLTIELEKFEENAIVEITNTLGQVIRQKTLSSNIIELSMDDLSSGIYLVKIKIGDSQYVQKVIKQ